jgi:hypothetical protein
MDEILDYLYNKELIFNEKKLYETAKSMNNNITHKDVKEFLKRQAPQQIYYRKPNKTKNLKITAETPYSSQMDLTFLPQYKSTNKNNYVIFTAINIISRYVYVNYSKDKSMETIIKFIKEMEGMTDIDIITCDEGTEFKNKLFEKFCDENNITVYYVKGDSHKLGIINRFHRTLKEHIEKYFDINKNTVWIDIIDKIVNNYNNTEHSSIHCTPEEANDNPFILKDIMDEGQEYNEKIKENEPIFKIGDFCRIKNISYIIFI